MLKVIHRTNTITELKKIPTGYGVEVDIRNASNKLILHHEPYEKGDSFEEFCSEFKHAFMIINIKTEGIEEKILSILKRYNIENYFWLDLTFPSIVKLMNKGEKNIAIRFSEYEPIESCLALKNKVNWVWVDTFTKLPLDKESFDKLKQSNFKICLVCPERWGRHEDIDDCIRYFHINKIKIDAVMTAKNYVKMWEKHD